VHAEGWYRDPYGLHDDRWFSDGRPTSLVRDQGLESDDEPPQAEPPLPLEPVTEAGDGQDLLRADAGEWEPEYEIEREGLNSADSLRSQAVILGPSVPAHWASCLPNAVDRRGSETDEGCEVLGEAALRLAAP
jgi:hypothetical protein